MLFLALSCILFAKVMRHAADGVFEWQNACCLTVWALYYATVSNILFTHLTVSIVLFCLGCVVILATARGREASRWSLRWTAS